MARKRKILDEVQAKKETGEISLDDALFWYDENEGKDGYQPNWKIDRIKLYNYIHEAYNIFLYSEDGEKKSYEIIRDNHNVLDNINELVVMKNIMDMVSCPALLPIKRILINNPPTYFAADKLAAGLPWYGKDDFMHDTEKDCYHFYKNCWVHITAEDITTHDYQALPAPIWKSQIIDREFTLADPAASHWGKFISIVATGKHYEKIDPEDDRDMMKILAMTAAQGYLIHGFKDVNRTKAVLSIDGHVQYDKKPEGGSGKSLFISGPQEIVKSFYIDGKIFKTNTEHPFSGMEKGSRIIIFDDIKKGFDLEFIFNVSTKGLAVNEKFEKSSFIKYAQSPKPYVTMNHIPDKDSASYRRRQHILEFGTFFNDRVQPYDIFKKRFFDDWDAAEYNLFDNWMMYAAQQFLANGLVPFPSENLAINKVINRVPTDVLDFFDNKIVPETVVDNVRVPETMVPRFQLYPAEYEKTEIFHDFQTAMEAQESDCIGIQKNQLTIHLKSWAEFKGWEINTHKLNGRDKRGNKDFVTFFEKK